MQDVVRNSVTPIQVIQDLMSEMNWNENALTVSVLPTDDTKTRAATLLASAFEFSECIRLFPGGHLAAGVGVSPDEGASKMFAPSSGLDAIRCVSPI